MIILTRTNTYLQFILISLLVTGGQLVCFNLLLVLYGDKGLTETLILSAVFFSMVAGESKLIPFSVVRNLCVSSGVLWIVFGGIFSGVILFFLKSWYAKLALSIFSLVPLIL